MTPDDVREAARLIVQFADAHDAAANESERALAMSALSDLIGDDDIVVEIARALLSQRCGRDEALYSKAEKTRPLYEFIAEQRDKERAAIRAEALEEAARVAEGRFYLSDGFEQWRAGDLIAKAIRALVSADKEKDGAAAGAAPMPPTAEASAASLLWRWQSYGCPDCNGDCASANPPIVSCIMRETAAAIKQASENAEAKKKPRKKRPVEWPFRRSDLEELKIIAQDVPLSPKDKDGNDGS